MSGAETVPAVVARVRVPVRWPVVVGAKAIWMKQEALGARVPVQGGPPVVLVIEGEVSGDGGWVRVMGVALEVRLVRVKRVGALVLWTGTVPKSCVTGVRMRPWSGRPVPVRVRV